MTTETIDATTGELTAATDPQAQAALFAKLARVMSKLERLPKNGYNNHFKYEFVEDADVLYVALAGKLEGVLVVL